MSRPKNPALFYGAIIIAIIAVLACVYYVLPGYNHILATHDFTSMQPKHALAFGAIAVLCIIVALVNRPRSATRQ
ncbi:MAG TPA: hypothetical protein VKV37_07415 [Ktedonobacteraceae bacterium]|nr:hypothetical protein [Ktedonobacteraceae bacterium]